MHTAGHYGSEFSLVNEGRLLPPPFFLFPQQLEKNETEARKRLSTPAVLTFRNTKNEELMTSSVLDTPGASLDYDSTNKPVVALKIKDNDTFYRTTKKVSESTDQLITIWLDYEEGDTYNPETCGIGENKKCISAATVKEGFTDNVIIQGNFNEKEANELVDLINSGSLPTKLTEISTNNYNNYNHTNNDFCI